VVGEALSQCIRSAFAHLGGTGSTPPLTVDLWDEAETGVRASHAPERWPAPSWGVGGGLLISFDGGRVVGHRLDHSVVWLDRESQRIVGSVTSADGLSLHERGKPLHYLLSLWHNDRGAYVIHAGLVAKAGRGVLFAGVGGSGKSSTALACTCGGFDFLGDDCVALEARADGRFLGHSVYSGAWVERDNLARFAALSAHVAAGLAPEDKALVRLDEAHPERLVRSAEIRAIVLPRVTGLAASRVRPASQGEALLALAPSSIVLFAPSPGADGVRQLGGLVRRIPAFWLELGTDVVSIPRAVDQVLEHV
jgi:hypothetical protein